VVYSGVWANPRSWGIFEKFCVTSNLAVCKCKVLSTVSYRKTWVAGCTSCCGSKCCPGSCAYVTHDPLCMTHDQNFGLGLKASSSALASNVWPQSAAEEPAANEEIDGPICLHFTLLTTGHHTMIEDSYCARERMRNETVSF